MNVLYTSQKLHELFADASHQTHANASGDGDGVPGRCCRLCGGDNNLRYFGDTYVWDGIEERYDHLLNDCFGVKVTSADCMICEWCVRALRTTGRFRALVHAAFDHPNSDHSSNETLTSSNGVEQDAKLTDKPETTDLPKKSDLAKRRDDRKRLMGSEVKAKRTNVACEICKQRYPMLVTAADSYKSFICSRCRKNGDTKETVCRKCNEVMPINQMTEHLERHAQADSRRKVRDEERKRVHYPYQPRKLATPDGVPKQRLHKFQCNMCPKKYALAWHLYLHVRNAHGDSQDNFCSICNQDMETHEKLKEHLLEHSGVHQCDECLLIFKNRKTLAAHSVKHHSESTTS